MTDTNVPVVPVLPPPKEHPDNDRIAHGNKERSDMHPHPVARRQAVMASRAAGRAELARAGW